MNTEDILLISSYYYDKNHNELFYIGVEERVDKYFIYKINEINIVSGNYHKHDEVYSSWKGFMEYINIDTGEINNIKMLSEELLKYFVKVNNEQVGMFKDKIEKLKVSMFKR